MRNQQKRGRKVIGPKIGWAERLFGGLVRPEAKLHQFSPQGYWAPPFWYWGCMGCRIWGICSSVTVIEESWE